MKNIPRAILVPLAVCAVFVGGVWWYVVRPDPLPEVFGVSGVGTTTTVASPSSETPSASLPEGMLRYENSEYAFSLAYPEYLRVQEFVESGGAHSVVFETVSREKGFQVYITPYAGSNVTRQQFLKDEPSGVYKEPTDIWVDGTPAIMFYGENGIMGETREVWFIRNGFLYEVTTYKEFDDWLAGIMATWKFKTS